jgi:hypothetical protein
VNWFLDAIDLSSNIERGLAAVRGVRGLPALILGAALSLICVALLPLVWYFDIDATLMASDSALGIVLPSLPVEAVGMAAFITLGLTLLPTLVELFGARFAAVGIRVASALVYLFSAFDMLTDWPRVVEFCGVFRERFDGMGFAAGLGFWLFRLLFLFLASFGFELLLVVFAVCALALLLNGAAGGQRAAMRGE